MRVAVGDATAGGMMTGAMRFHAWTVRLPHPSIDSGQGFR
jgi:hypothetical protein